MTCHDLAKRGRNLLPATACPPIVMASGQCPYRLLFIYGYKIVGSSSRMPSLPLFSNSYPVPLSGAAFHIRSALLLFCSSPVLQFTSGTPLSMCKPSKSDGPALRSAAVQPGNVYRMLKMLKLRQIAANARVTLQTLTLAWGHWASFALDEPCPIKSSACLTPQNVLEI